MHVLATYTARNPEVILITPHMILSFLPPTVLNSRSRLVQLPHIPRLTESICLILHVFLVLFSAGVNKHSCLQAGLCKGQLAFTLYPNKRLMKRPRNLNFELVVFMNNVCAQVIYLFYLTPCVVALHTIYA